MSKPRLGTLRVSTQLLEQMFCFPIGCVITGGTYDSERELINLTLSYAALPEVSDGEELPLVTLRARVEIHPDAPDFRRPTTSIELPLEVL